MTDNLQKPGETPKKPGTYEETGERGGKVKNPRHPTMGPEDNHLPPTQEPKRKWKPIPSSKKTK